MTPLGGYFEDPEDFDVIDGSAIFSTLRSLKTCHIVCWTTDTHGTWGKYPESEVYIHRLPSKLSPHSDTQKVLALTYLHDEQQEHRTISSRNFEEVDLDDGVFVGKDAPYPWVFEDVEMERVKSCCPDEFLDCWQGEWVSAKRIDDQNEGESDEENEEEEEDQDEGT